MTFAESFIAGHQAGTKEMLERKRQALAENELELTKQFHEAQIKNLKFQQGMSQHQAARAEAEAQAKALEGMPEASVLGATGGTGAVTTPGMEASEAGPAIPAATIPIRTQEMAVKGAEAMKQAQLAGEQLPEDLSIPSLGFTVHKGTDKGLAAALIHSVGAVRAAQTQAQVKLSDPERLMIAKLLGQGGGGGGPAAPAPEAPPAAPTAPGAPAPAAAPAASAPARPTPGPSVKLPGLLGSYVGSTSDGRQFFNGSALKGKMGEIASMTAATAGIPVLDKGGVETVKNVEIARKNVQDMATTLEPYLPKDAAGRIIAGPSNTIGQYLQTKPALAAFKAWQTVAVSQLRAMAGSTNLRINLPEVKMALESMPEITDSWPAAQKKAQFVNQVLSNQLDALFRTSPGFKGDQAVKELTNTGVVTHRYNPSTGKTEPIQ